MSSHADLDLLCIGEPLMELNQARGGSHFLPGHGGDTSNCAVAAARQGARVGYFTALGEDAFGDSFLELWRAEGVDASRVCRDPDAHTGVYFVSHDGDGHRFSYLRAGSAASRITADKLPQQAITEARFLHVSGISQAISDSACDTVFRAIELARGGGVRVSYDPNLRLQLWPLARARAVIHAAMADCHIALPGLDDAAQLTGHSEPNAIVDFYLTLGAELVALTLGAAGALVATPEQRRRVPAPRVAAVDATAAGDTFDGALLAELAAGREPFAAAEYAVAAAALSTRGYGAVTPMPRRAEVEQFLRRG